METSYLIGTILGSLLQPSTILIFIISFFSISRWLLIIVTFILCFGQWLIIGRLGGGVLGIGSLIIPLLAGLLVMYVITSFRRKRN